MQHDYQHLFGMLEENGMSDWSATLQQQLADYFTEVKHGDYPKWKAAIDSMPSIKPGSIALQQDAVQIGTTKDLSEQDKSLLHTQLQTLMPWRKGPFNLFGIQIDTEWRSNLKWQRLHSHIKPLQNRTVLDVGCGNGYYGLRMLGQGASYVLGVDPTLLFLMQFRAINKYLATDNMSIIPFGIQALPEYELNFDTVFSMGVIYHRRDPLAHLQQLRNCLIPGGELVLETLVIEADGAESLTPQGRYAKMNNVHEIPSCQLLLAWAEKAGFHKPRIIDVTRTSLGEQRVTDWMQYESLADFLDEHDPSKTIEGYPAPVRAILLADK